MTRSSERSCRIRRHVISWRRVGRHWIGVVGERIRWARVVMVEWSASIIWGKV